MNPPCVLCSQLSCSQCQAMPLLLPWLSPWKRASQTRRGQWSRLIWEGSPESWEAPVSSRSQNQPRATCFPLSGPMSDWPSVNSDACGTEWTRTWFWWSLLCVLVCWQEKRTQRRLCFPLVMLCLCHWWQQTDVHVSDVSTTFPSTQNRQRVFRSWTHAEDGPGVWTVLLWTVGWNRS